MNLEYRGRILDESLDSDMAFLDELRADPHVEFVDTRAEQRRGLTELTPPPTDDLLAEDSRWVYYSWRRTCVGILGPKSFRRLRLDRNRNKITTEEQDHFGTLTIGVIGLSVGHAIAHTLALEGLCGELRLADFDEIELSNLNRIPGTLLDLGVNKAVVVARRIAELDPYLSVIVDQRGITRESIDEFSDGLDIMIEECDSLDIKVLARDAASARGIPILMETSDRGLLDVERYDLDPTLPYFNGLLGTDFDFASFADMSPEDKVPHVFRILPPSQLSDRMVSSMLEVGKTVSTWPQLGGDVALGGASVAAAVRRIGRGEPLPSGRTSIDLSAALDAIDSGTGDESRPLPGMRER
ncbi:Rv1355c family protein [Antrihabitans stalactiti]|uniref:Rv1355c family protein n=1 Tax=Antrihabitans stalactiti TaxID=2584121 RepID=A0A848KGF8_9NOCA|nr:Rv1355c family protein [Antrihabitans stalactiti]